MINRGVIGDARATTALDRLLSLPVTVSRSQPLIGTAWSLRRNLTIQDAVYVVLAHELSAPLLTADQRIAGAPDLPVDVLHISAAQ